MDRFSRLNPKVTLLFFIVEIIFTIAVFNPVCLALSLACACIYKLKLDGKNAVKYIFKFLLPLLVIVMLFNFIFTHYGETVFFTLFEMNFTAEALFYGFAQGMMLCAVVVWFSNYSRVITSERFLAVFGRFMPNLALMFSMVLTFIPRLKKNAEEINDARMLIDSDSSKLKKSINNFSALVTMTLEESIDIADSMKARGFNKDRTVYSKYRFSSRDFIVLMIIIITSVGVIVAKAMGLFSFIYEPVIIAEKIPLWAIFSYVILSLLPSIIDFVEDMRWSYLKQKI